MYELQINSQATRIESSDSLYLKTENLTSDSSYMNIKPTYAEIISDSTYISNLHPGNVIDISNEMTVADFNAAGDVNVYGSFFPKQVSYSTNMDTDVAGTEGEIVYCTTDNKFYGCTVTGAAGSATWAAFH